MRYFVIILIAVFAAISSSQSSAGIIEKGAKAYIAGKVVKKIYLSAKKYPESVKHIIDAQKNGAPKTLTVDRAGAAERRKAALKGTKTEPGKDRDEYPLAMTKEGGEGASVRLISKNDNRGSGACIGAQCRGVRDGDRIEIIVDD